MAKFNVGEYVVCLTNEVGKVVEVDRKDRRIKTLDGGSHWEESKNLRQAMVIDCVRTLSTEELASIIVAGRCPKCSHYRKNANTSDDKPRIISCKNISCYEGVKNFLEQKLTDDVVILLGGNPQ